MLKIFSSDPFFDIKKILLKNPVTPVTWLQPLSSKGYSVTEAQNKKVTKVTKKVTKVTESYKKIMQNQQCNRVTDVTAKNNNIIFTSEDWLMMFEERAAILEYEGGENRPTAEEKAFDECVLKLLKLDKKHTLNTAVPYLISCGLHNPFYK